MTKAGHFRRWDPLVKLTHWSVAGTVLANAVLTEKGSNAHIWVGYALAAILGLRLLWGLIGPAEARFSAFPPSLRRALAHVAEMMRGGRQRHRSHNPLGALMVYAIWSCLLAIIGTGIAMAGLPGQAEPEVAAAVAMPPAVFERASFITDGESDAQEDEMRGEAGEREEGPVAEVHEAAANLLYLLILLHLAGVIFETRRSGRDVVLAMLPGRG